MKCRQELIAQITGMNLSRKEMLKELLGFLFEKQYENPLMEIMMNEKRMQEIMTKIPEDKLARFLDRDERMVRQLNDIFGEGFKQHRPEGPKRTL